MFGTIRKHQTWLWVLIIAVVSVSMVVFFSSDVSFTGGGAPVGDYGSINGRPISHTEYVNAYREAQLSEFIQTGKWPGSDEATSRRLENQTLYRLLLIHRAKEMDIRPSDKAVAILVQEQLRDAPYDRFASEYLEPNGLKITDYERMVRNDATIRQLLAAASINARLVTPAEAETLWKKDNQEMAGQLAVFWASNYMDQVTLTNGAVGAFYTNRMGFYRLPERLIVSYVEFPATNFLAAADEAMAKSTNLNEIVSDYYFRGPGGTNRWTDTNGVALTEAAAKEKIREMFRQNEALMAARRAATEFGTELFNQADPNQAANLEKLAAAKGLQPKATQPFDHTSGLAELSHEKDDYPVQDDRRPEFKDAFREKAYTLSQERPILFSPLVGRKSVYVIARKSTVPSELQALDKIKDKVTSDLKTFLAADMARKAAQSFHTNLTNGLTAKKPFNELASAAKVKTLDIPPFSPSTRQLTNFDARVNLQYLQNIVSKLDPGQASSPQPAQPPSEGLWVFYLKDRLPIDTAKMSSELPEFISQIRFYRQNEAFNQWLQRQAELVKFVMPKRETRSVGPAAGVN